MAIEATGAQPRSNSRFALAGLAALGVVFGDIGTSPLYTLKTVLDYTGPHPRSGGGDGRPVADPVDPLPHHHCQVR